MISYDDLVSALARWRQRQGLPAGPADYLGGESAETRANDGAAASSQRDHQGGYNGGYQVEAERDPHTDSDVVELSEDVLEGVLEAGGEVEIEASYDYRPASRAGSEAEAAEVSVEHEDGPGSSANGKLSRQGTGGRRKRRR